MCNFGTAVNDTAGCEQLSVPLRQKFPDRAPLSHNPQSTYRCLTVAFLRRVPPSPSGWRLLFSCCVATCPPFVFIETPAGDCGEIRLGGAAGR